MKDDLISVIIPVYNVEKYVEKCVNSIICQSYTHLEIILVDDGSVDKSGAVCDALARKDNRIIVIHKENGGLSDARNVGLQRSSGCYVSFVDADDYVDVDFIKILYSNATETGSSISISNYLKVYEDEEPKITEIVNDRVIMTKEQGLEALFDNRYKYQFTMACGKIFAKSVFENFLFPVGRNYEDSATAHVLISKVDRIVYTSRKQYFYLTRKSSITRSEKFLKDDIIVAMKDRMEWFARNGYPELEKKASVQYILTMMGVHARLPHNVETESMKTTLYEEVRECIKREPNIKRQGLINTIRIRLFLLSPSLYSVFIKSKKWL